MGIWFGDFKIPCKPGAKHRNPMDSPHVLHRYRFSPMSGCRWLYIEDYRDHKLTWFLNTPTVKISVTVFSLALEPFLPIINLSGANEKGHRKILFHKRKERRKNACPRISQFYNSINPFLWQKGFYIEHGYQIFIRPICFLLILRVRTSWTSQLPFPYHVVIDNHAHPFLHLLNLYHHPNHLLYPI